MVQFLALGLQIPQIHPDRKSIIHEDQAKRSSIFRCREITADEPGDYPCSLHDWEFMDAAMNKSRALEAVLPNNGPEPARTSANALLDHGVKTR